MEAVNRGIEEVVLKYWFRLCSMEGGRVTRKIFRRSSKLAEEGCYNWAKRTQSLVDLASDRLDSPLPGTVQDLSRTVRNSLFGVEFSKWKDDINRIPPNTVSGALNRILKEEPVVEDYIMNVIPRDRRRTLVMLRTGCLPLAIETG